MPHIERVNVCEISRKMVDQMRRIDAELVSTKMTVQQMLEHQATLRLQTDDTWEQIAEKYPEIEKVLGVKGIRIDTKTNQVFYMDRRPTDTEMEKAITQLEALEEPTEEQTAALADVKEQMKNYVPPAPKDEDDTEVVGEH